MPEGSRAPLLGDSPNQDSQSNTRSASQGDSDLSETTPLLSHRNEGLDADNISTTGSHSTDSKKKNQLRWPTVIALVLLCLSVIAILILGFAAPSAVKHYVEEAAVFEPKGLSITSFTPSGVRTRVRGSFTLHASRVNNPSVRDLGRFGTWVAREIETSETEVEVSLPDYGNVVLGTVVVPRIKVNIRNGYKNDIDIIAELRTGNVDGIRAVANDWLEGRLGRLSIKGNADVPLRSGILHLGSQSISETLVFEELSSLPDFNITKLDIHEYSAPGQPKAIEADVSLSVLNNYPIQLTVPSSQFDILVPNCAPGEEYILVANATTESVDLQPHKSALVSIHGLAYEIPAALTSVCPGKASSPLDLLLRKYIHGSETRLYVRGKTFESSTYPQWLQELLSSVTIPVPFTSHGLSRLVKRFSMKNVHFDLPDPYADPDTPEAQPKVSALVKAIINLPHEMNFPLNISRVQTYADVYYSGEKLGILDIKEWQNSTVREITDDPSGQPAMEVEFDIQKAPLNITNSDLLTEILQKMIFQRKSIPLHVKSLITPEVQTGLGTFIVRDIPASGNITVTPPAIGGLKDLNLRIESLRIAETTKNNILVRAHVNFTNPTNYTAHLPYLDIKLGYNSTDIAHIIARNINIHPGPNNSIGIDGLWNPLEESGDKGVAAGQNLISQYVSGLNTTVSLKSYAKSIPSLPSLGQALSKLEFHFPVPKLRIPDDGGNEHKGGKGKGFIRDATFYILSSTADFILMSPLPSTTLYVTSVNATALFNHTEPIGRIEYETSFAVPPGKSKTPPLPVEVDLGGAGYQALKDALGGTLKMDAIAEIGVKLGEYTTILNYYGQGIGARVRI
ncbi:hypothetical protein FQN57_005818 [Myotisia sp. PD_48]|nr:hypothetical protein FQN57_005818 [Myotisia sp. PD_48]